MPTGDGPQRIAFCITELDPGGAERMLVELVTRLDKREFSPAVFCLGQRGKLADRLAAADIPVICLGARHSRQFWIVAKLARELNRWRPALLQTFLFHANLAGRLAGRLARIPRIVSGIRVAERRSRVPLWADRWTNWLVDRHVCVSQSVADFSVHEGGLPASRVTIIPNGIDVSRFEGVAGADLSVFGIPAGGRTILSVGRLDAQKAPELLLETAPALFACFPDVHILYVGEGPLRSSLERSVRDRQLEQRVHFAGWQAEIPALMKAAWCLALTSRWEGMPNVVLEALAAGLPVVAADVEGVRELIPDEGVGMVFPAGSASELERMLKRLLADPLYRRELAEASQTYVATRFSMDAMVESYAALYRTLLGHADRV